MLRDYLSKEPKSTLLPEGEHVVRLLSYLETDSMSSIKNGKPAGAKNRTWEWINAVPQVFILCGNDKGVAPYRLTMQGVTRYTELSDKQISSGKYVDIEGYACEKTKDGLVRLVDDERTDICERIFDHLLWSLGAPAGTPADQVLDTAITSKIEFKIKVVHDPWTNDSGDDVEQLRITRFERITSSGNSDVDIEA